jgi:hypothetical protein
VKEPLHPVFLCAWVGIGGPLLPVSNCFFLFMLVYGHLQIAVTCSDLVLLPVIFLFLKAALQYLVNFPVTALLLFETEASLRP